MHEPGITDEVDAIARGPIGQGLFLLTKFFAIAGGLMFLALVAMSLVSIIGRKLAAAPVPGDIEMMQMGTAVGSAAMLAYCEMVRHHLRVDFFTANISAANKNRLDGFSHFLVAAVGALMAWRTTAAALSLREAGETSMMLSWPVWPAVMMLVPSFAMLAVAGFYNAAVYWSTANAQEQTA